MSQKDNPTGNEGEDVTKIKAELAEATQKLANATNELIDGRKTRQELEADRDALKVKLAEAEEKVKGGQPPQGALTEADVRKILAEREKQDAAANRQAAEAKFKAAHKEFADDADAGGVKFSAVKQKFSRFNLEGVVTVDEFLNLFEEAYTLAVPTRASGDGKSVLNANTPSDTGHNPKETTDDQLSHKEKTVMERLGWTKDQFLKQKAARPTYIRQLLSHME